MKKGHQGEWRDNRGYGRSKREEENDVTMRRESRGEIGGRGGAIERGGEERKKKEEK